MYIICARIRTDIPNNYPAICKHLEQFKGKGQLGDNSTTKVFKRPWWSLMQEPVNYWEDFYKQKIVWNRITKEKNFSLVEDGVLIQDSMHFIVGNNLNFICAILNSRTFQLLLNLIIGDAVGGNSGNSDNIKNLKLQIPTIESKLKIETLVDKIISSKGLDTKIFENQIDEIIFKMYELTEQEIEFIKHKDTL